VDLNDWTYISVRTWWMIDKTFPTGKLISWCLYVSWSNIKAGQLPKITLIRPQNRVGGMARIDNHYPGGKTPKSDNSSPPLSLKFDINLCQITINLIEWNSIK